MRHLSRLAAGLLVGCLSVQLVRAQGPEPPAPTTVRVGLIDTFTPSFYIDVYTPLIEFLKARLPQYVFVTNEIAHSDLNRADIVTDNDFLIVSSNVARMLPQSGLHQIATLRRNAHSDVAQSIGAVFVVPADSPIKTLEDLKGRRAAANAPWAFAGWIIPQGEIAAHGFDPDQFFKEVTFTEWNFPDVLTLVTTGMSDVGILETCELEQALRSGVIAEGDLRVIGARPEKAPGRCVTSTDLYPDMMFASSPVADPNIVKDVTVALLSMPADASGFDWLSNSRTQNVETLLKRLKIGPYDYLRNETFADVVSRYRNEIMFAVLLLLVLVAHHFRVNLLLKRRTTALLAEERARMEAADALRRSQEKLGLIERAGMASQLAAMFAHELKQPLTIIANYLSGMRIMMAHGQADQEKFTLAVTHAEREAHRAADIIERVRSALRKESPVMLPVDIKPVVESAVRHAGRSARETEIVISASSEAIYVEGDALELELVLVNLIKNACRANAALETPAPVVIALTADEREVRIRVEDEGRPIDDEVFARLGKLTRSQSTDGLGFGLFISTSVAEAHRGHLTFERREPQGLAATLVLPRHHPTELPS